MVSKVSLLLFNLSHLRVVFYYYLSTQPQTHAQSEQHNYQQYTPTLTQTALGGQHLAERLTQLAMGNVAVIFKNAWENLDTLVHEIGHSLTLRHVFDSKAQYTFYQGFSDKVMDYTWQAISKRTNSKKRMSFTRYQWYEMQKDTSIYRI